MTKTKRKPGFTTGIHSALAGLGLIFRPRLRRFVVIPLLINIVLFSLGIYLLAGYIETGLDRWLPDWLDFARWLLWPLLAIGAALVTFFSFTVVANLVGAPFNGVLSERVLQRLDEDAAPAQSGSLLKEVPLAITGELRKLTWFILRAIPLLLLFVIPGVNIAAPFIWFAFGAWYLAMEYADYPLGNAGMRFGEQRRWLRGHRRATLGFGSVITVMTLIPVVNFIAMPVAVAGATVLWHRIGNTAEE